MGSLIRSILSRIIQPSSFAGYIIGALTAWGIQFEGPVETELLKWLAATGALLLVLVNERSWRKR